MSVRAMPLLAGYSVTTFAVASLMATITDGSVLQAQITLTEMADEVGLAATHQAIMDNPRRLQQKTGGVAVADFNNDGWSDLFWLGGGGVADKLFLNNGDGTFTDQAEAWGVAVLHHGCGAAAGDFDNDGWVDVFVTSFGPPDVTEGAPGYDRLYRNNGDGSFGEVAVEAGVNDSHQDDPGTFGASFGDYDLDGDLDLFVTYWMPEEESDSGNKLYRNNGDSTFTDVTDEAIGASLSGVHGYAPAFVDMNQDLYPELLIAADYLSSRYYVNDGDGTFSDHTVESGAGLDENGMGHFIADVNNDGLFDWYVTAIYILNGFIPGNMLYLQQADHVYVESASTAGVDDGAWGWGTIAVDLDHDGWLDILEVNGWHMVDWVDVPGRLFHNNRDGTFTEIAAMVGFDSDRQGRGIVTIDADNDGDRDVIVINNGAAAFDDANDGRLEFYRNDTKDVGSWLRITFDTSTNPLLAPNGFGTRVTATAGGQTYHQHVHGNCGYVATSELTVHLGLGDALAIDELRVTWSRGYETVLQELAINQHLTLVAPELADLDADGQVGASDLIVLLGAWGDVEEPAQLKADVNNDRVVSTTDLLILLGSWGSGG